ncbi:MAG: hypothetical protein FWD91_02125 [Treponema sp.]|nr:hypothetical protein [Treponema sp.]
MKTSTAALVFLLLFSFSAHGENVRALVAGINRVSLNEPDGITVPLSHVSSSLITIDGDTRFFRGIQLELAAPAAFLSHEGSLAVEIYGDLDNVAGTGIADINGRQLAYTILPARIRTIYQIPLRDDHGLRTSPYATVLIDDVISADSFPLLFRIMPIGKGTSRELESMKFDLTVKPLLTNEGALRIDFRYPENLPNRAVTVFINGKLMENPTSEQLLTEGEHHLVILSEDYRNQSSTFVVERARVLELTVMLQDTTPLLVFDHPESVQVFLNDELVPNSHTPHPVEPGVHEVRFHIGDHTIMRSVTIQKGQTYRVSLSLDMLITESE